jgi:colanic acid/amylovoran biosynthesis protein
MPANRKSLTGILDKSILILLRDKQSMNNLIDMGIKNDGIQVTADAAFALADPAAVEAAKQTRRFNSPLRIAISVRQWRHFKTKNPDIGMSHYLEAVRAVTLHFVNEYAAEITFISTCQGMPEYWTDDSKLAKQIVETLPESVRDSIRVDSSFHHPKELAEILKRYDMVIATRMHVAILALGAGVPVLPIAYEFKMKEMFEKLGQSCWVQDIETINDQSLIKAVDLFLHSMPGICESLFAAVQKERESALESAGLVKKAFHQWQESNSLRNIARFRANGGV